MHTDGKMTDCEWDWERECMYVCTCPNVEVSLWLSALILLSLAGVYVDPRILPGFRYRVRHVGTENYLFDGRALTLQSIGLGYGKRLTFTGDSLNFNDNYFWSDSDPNGFAFSLDAVQPADRLTVYGNDGSGIIGEVKVERVPRIQEEISSKVIFLSLSPCSLVKNVVKYVVQKENKLLLIVAWSSCWPELDLGPINREFADLEVVHVCLLLFLTMISGLTIIS